jgi:hypothetical protein
VFLTIIGSGALFSFIQFLIQRKDILKKEEKEDQISQLRHELKEGLDDRENRGLQRYTEHQEAIAKLNEAILQLTENDTQMKEYMKYVGDEIVGLAHDKLVYLTDKYQERGAITLKEKATLEAIYVPYHSGLGGNGDGKAGYEFAMQLPIVTDSQAHEMDKRNKYMEDERAL